MRARLLLLGPIAGLAASAGHAQSSNNPVTVNNSTGARTAVPPPVTTEEARVPNPEAEPLEPLGAHLGAFTVYPRLDTTAGYNSNLFATESDVGSAVVTVSPSFAAEGDFGVETLALRGGLDHASFIDHPSENRTDWNLGATGRWEPRRRSYVTLDGGFTSAHEDRADPDSSYAAKRPTAYSLAEAGLSASTELTRLLAGMDLTFRSYNFQDGERVGGGVINNDDRDRGQVAGSLRLGYQFTPGYALVGRVFADHVGYRRVPDDGGFDRDSTGWRATIGLGLTFTHVLSGEIYGGYLQRHYQDNRFRDVQRPVFGAALTWNPTSLTTVRLYADRSVQETTIFGYDGFVTTGVSARVQHQLTRSLQLTATLRYGRDRYVTSVLEEAPRRTDTNWGGSLGARYAFSRRLYATLSYDRASRDTDSGEPGVSFGRNRVLGGVGVQL